MDMDEMITEMKRIFKPYENSFEKHRDIPEKGIERDEILKILRELIIPENRVWETGHVSGAVYQGENAHVEFTNNAYSIASQNNPLHPDVWPSSLKFESEIVSMTRSMLRGDEGVRGTVTSGGTESILLAMKTYRDYSRDIKGIEHPEIVLPKSAHAAFHKACHYFGIKATWTDLREDYTADPVAIEKEINENTIAIIGSAPCFPYGVVDPIEELSRLAVKHKVGLHVDACLGGFILPWARELGYDIPDFDFKLEGVTSMSADTHKYGYAPKGTSIVLYRNSELLQKQLYVNPDWCGGIYFSPTLSGSRSGGVIASAWAAILETGVDGYMNATRRIIETTRKIREGVKTIEELEEMGNGPFVVAFRSNSVNIYQVLALMSKRSWILNGLHRPPGAHIAVTLRHTFEGVADKFISDLRDCVKQAKENPDTESGMAPVYGMAATYPEDAVSEIMKTLVEWMYS